MQFFQCGIPSGGDFRRPLAIECGPGLPRPDSARYRQGQRRDDTISEFYSFAQDLDQRNDANNNEDAHSVDDMISPFEQDLALDRNAIYAQHEQDLDEKIKDILNFRSQATSVKASVEKAAEKFRKSAVTERRVRKKEGSLIVEDLEASLPKAVSPHKRIFCKLQQSERFKVFCFPRYAKSLVQLLRGIEDKLMYGVQSDRPGRLLLIVNNRAAFREDFVEIDDIHSIRDEDRFVFLPYLREELLNGDDRQEEQLDLNYSTSDVESTKQDLQPRSGSDVRMDPYTRIGSISPTRQSRRSNPLSSLNQTGYRSTAPQGNASYAGPELPGWSIDGDDRIDAVSNAKSGSFDWDLDDKDCDDPVDHRQNKEDVSRSNGGNHEMEEVRDGPPKTTSRQSTKAARANISRDTDARKMVRKSKKNRTKQEREGRKGNHSQGDSDDDHSPGFGTDRYCQGPFNDFD